VIREPRRCRSTDIAAPMNQTSGTPLDPHPILDHGRDHNKCVALPVVPIVSASRFRVVPQLLASCQRAHNATTLAELRQRHLVDRSRVGEMIRYGPVDCPRVPLRP
jgi:hypothetical protein